MFNIPFAGSYPEALDETNLNPAGTKSFTTTFVAFNLALFVTLTTKVMSSLT